MYRTLLRIAGLLLLSAPATAGTGPSFDCAKARTGSERLICASPVLSLYDAELASRYLAFVGALEEPAKASARRMQRLWLRSRDNICFSSVEYPFAGSENEQFKMNRLADEIREDAFVFASHVAPEVCLETYYKSAIEALDQGVLLSYLELAGGTDRFTVGVGSLREVRMEDANEAPEQAAACATGAQKQITYFAVTESGSHHMATSFSDQCGNSRNLRQLRMYMHASGAIDFAINGYARKKQAECSPANSLFLQFIDVQPDGVKSASHDMTIAGRAAACESLRHRLLGWRAENGQLVFTVADTTNTEYTYGLAFPSVRDHVIGHRATSVEPRDFIDASKETYRGESYARLYDAAVIATRSSKYAYNERGEGICRQIDEQLTKYLRFKEYATSRFVSLEQAFHLAKSVLDNGSHLDELKAAKPLVQVLISYLEGIQHDRDWEMKLADIYTEYAQREGTNLDTRPISSRGYPTGRSCLSRMSSPADGMNMEEWVYTFWARRHVDGNLEQTRQLLTRVNALAPNP